MGGILLILFNSVNSTRVPLALSELNALYFNRNFALTY